MRLLHTSDWHLGATLCGRKRYDEGEHFLNWLTALIASEKIETLIVAGDVFDSGTPSNRALELYYRFLSRVARSGCHHIVVIAGNHDSPSLLAAPKELLSALDIHVVGAISDLPDEQVFILEDESGSPSLILCAVPYLRDRDIRIAEAGESIDEKKVCLIKGIYNHYRDVCTFAESHRQRLGEEIPIVATGHLFAAGGTTISDDGVRDLSIGNLVQVGADAFPACIDYLALGHLHQPQMVGGRPDRRYCGAPIIMGFGESTRQKEVVMVDITRGRHVTTTTIPVPSIRSYMQITGDTETVLARLSELKFAGKPAWVEILLNEPGIIPGDREEIYRETEGSSIDVLKVKNTRLITASLNQVHKHESLEELTPMEVFTRCLESSEEPREHWDDLLAAYQEILTVTLEADTREE